MPTNTTVFPLNSDTFFAHVGRSRQANYIYSYLCEQKAKVFVKEEYIDKSYLIDYQKFYSRSFSNWGKITDRIHFFSKDFTTDDFEKALKENKTSFLNKSYLGFVVVKPIKDPSGQPLIGRTLLKTYPMRSGNYTRFYVKKAHIASLFGVKMEIESAPFQAQDRGVSACATVALWTALQSAPSHFDIPTYSPSEITELSTEYPSPFRMSPQFGLTLGQMINCIHLVGLDAEVIKTKDNDIISTAVKAYTFAGIPLIGALILKDLNAPSDTEEDAHAVVIVGYKSNADGEVVELYVHDDQIGPYHRVKPIGDFTKWNNEWSNLGYEVTLDKLLIPIYHKIRLAFPSIYYHYTNKKTRLGNDVNLDLYLTTIQDYKQWLLGKNIDDKITKLEMALPRLLWIERTSDKETKKLLQDDIIDGTAIRAKKLTSIYYT